MISMRSIEGFEYRAPNSLEETVKILESAPDRCRVLAGGTDLILQMKQRLISASYIIDVKKIPDLNRLEWNEQEGLHIGAAVPISKLLAFRGLPEEYGILMQACSLIGSVQIKNRGTLGGNICNAAPSADSVPPLLCLDARCNIASSEGVRTIPLDELFLAPGKTCLESNELLVEIQVPPPSGRSAGCYLRHTTREEMDIAVAGVAAYLTLEKQTGQVKSARIALGAVAPTPLRSPKAEAELSNKVLSQDIIEKAAEVASREADPISDVRGSGEYRREIVRVLTMRSIGKACETLDLRIQ